MKRQAIVTIVSNNYLHYARTLMESVKRHHPDAQRYCVIVDVDPAPGAALAAEFEAIPLSVLDLPFGDEFTFQYTILELNTAVKPWALEYLFKQGYDQVFYIDPDIRLYRRLDEVEALIDGGAQIVLTPHLVAPMTDARLPSERLIRIAGTYNLGFIALGAGAVTLAMLRWWQGKLARGCVVDKVNGIFVDQSWMDLVPGLFDQVAVLRHPGFNVAYWNLAQREVSGDPGALLVNGQRLAFFHYSGIDPRNPQPVSKHQDRLTLDSLTPAARTLFLDYCRDVLANGQEHYGRLPYGFANFADGTPIPGELRARFLVTPGLRKYTGGKPFNFPELGAARASLGVERLNAIYLYFLRRPADPEAVERNGERCASWPGYLRTAVGVARSAESRRRPGWIGRLLAWCLIGRHAADVGLAPVLPAPEVPVLPVAPVAPAVRRQAGINLVAYIAAELGVGEAARSLARACQAVGVPYSVVDVGYQSSNLQRDTQALDHATDVRYPIDVVYVNADQTPATMNHLATRQLTSDYKIGFWHWEQPRLPKAHLDAFKLLDEVWVPSTFVRDAVAAVSPLPVVVIPHALQFAPTPGITRAAFGLPEHTLLALVMYDFHSYQQRKNPQAAIAAFRQAAAGRSDCALVVKTINGDQHPAEHAALMAELAGLPGTIVIDNFLTRQQVWDLQSCCDLLISLHRAEGFGLAPAEMMYLGKPVVATGWSANMDFMTTENSMPVHFTLAPLAEAVGAYPAGPLWAEADVGHAAACITRLLDDAGLRASIGQRAAADIRRQLDPAVVGKLVAERLAAIAHWRPALG